MPLNKSSIEWCTHTWNPVTGCLHGCEYCYARRIARRFGKRVPDLSAYSQKHPSCHCIDSQLRNNPYPYGFDPTLHVYRLNDPEQHKKPTRIFVGSMCDLFGDWVPDEWIEAVFTACAAAPWHTYMFLTKNPERYYDIVPIISRIDQKTNFVRGPYYCGASVTTQTQADAAAKTWANWFSVEPMLERIDISGLLDTEPWGAQKALWIVIGAETGNRNGKIIPERAWIEEICAEADAAGVPVFMKDSLLPIMGERYMRRETPWDQGR